MMNSEIDSSPYNYFELHFLFFHKIKDYGNIFGSPSSKKSSKNKKYSDPISRENERRLDILSWLNDFTSAILFYPLRNSLN